MSANISQEDKYLGTSDYILSDTVDINNNSNPIKTDKLDDTSLTKTIELKNKDKEIHIKQDFGTSKGFPLSSFKKKKKEALQRLAQIQIEKNN